MKVSPCFLLSLLLVAVSPVAWGQAAPDTEVFLVSLKSRKKEVQVGKPLNISQRPGYDNQPSFTPDGKSILYTSQRDGAQTDIYQYFLKGKKTQQLTHTPENEYSPLVLPDGQNFSVVRGKEQDLWTFPLQPNRSQPKLLLDFPLLVGYHVWYGQDTLLIAAFPEQPPMALYLVKPGQKDQPAPLVPAIGRSLQKVPGQPAISYLVPVSKAEGEIWQYHPVTNQHLKIEQALPGSQDMAWLPNRRLLMAKGAKLFLLDPGPDAQWQEIADFSKMGIKSITRLAVSPKGEYLAFVANQ
jgi:dipeptidyl aminopeptidase/acylaminoacyl peptidase